ncbi:putative membrane protein YeaQ/YmgE (transglycosylase-associated protein family) [Parabacteroides sp. PFB2-10]|uniref:GlsB/YeaQ/YmgE family stress response membrane protein n=1 Tax=Parabacteroides sp. PFB2-10 TaxID=1742405 RepID=UPI00247642E6|nr:GlsB/YeaQ/YmgE family stress response membrane protein [Parabacteroides sp. PFB2-10]MDH6312642.1 putative membrane protein YeaQ/YmgE (transglycosylase-associated protein family) [Parabacteroides sp. PFB2-10]MDL2245491.1 GlsB/YeaQ/YmgE family stress response membrane protein [Parabacteroides sp. OttesenSCG-928-J18]
MGILWSIIIGILAGAIAGWLMKGSGFGIIINLIVGLVGSVLGGWIYGLLGFSTSSILGTLLMSVIGAVVLLWIVSFISKRMK